MKTLALENKESGKTAIWGVSGRKEEQDRFSTNAVVISGFVAKQMSLRSLAPMLLSSMRTLLAAGDLSAALEQAQLLLKETKAASPAGLLPGSAASEYRLLRRELAIAMTDAGLAISALSPLTIGIDDAAYDLGEYSRLYGLQQLEGLLKQTGLAKVNGYA
ncbi:MAG: hypothetical protein M1530_03835 [Candidatus Marsarchaeota archaeon]|nr:hypothetical protein [Candidatus Marsarchaeota archaeon]